MQKYRHIIFLLLAFCLAHNASNAQFNGFPVRNYTPAEYNGFTQNWMTVQDSRGVIYVGNSSNVLEYDGRSWRKITITEGVAVRSLFIDSTGTIYVGSVGDFGKLVPQHDGTLVYRSLKNLIPGQAQSFSDVWKIHGYKGKIIFQTTENLFFFDGKTISIITPHIGFSSLSFVCDGEFYIRERKTGLEKLVNGRVELLSEGEKFFDEPILGIIPYRGKKLILSGTQGFFILDEEKKLITHQQLQDEKKLMDAGVLGLQRIRKDLIMVSTRTGVLFLDPDLHIIRTVGKREGLNDETIADMFVDRQNELWLSTNNGISRLSINSPLYYYNASSGFRGNIQAITVFQGRIFLGTTMGMFAADLNGNDDSREPQELAFHHIEGTIFETWNFGRHDNNLLAATSDGVFSVKDNSATRVTKQYSNSISASVAMPNRIYIAEKGGLRLLKSAGDGRYTELHYFDFGADDIMTVEEYAEDDDSTRLWITTRNTGLLQLSFSRDYSYSLRRFMDFSTTNRAQVQMVRENNRIFFTTQFGSFLYDKKENRFRPAKPSTHPYDNAGVHSIYWDSVSALGKKAILGMRAMSEVPYSFFRDNEQVLWVGLTTELVRFSGAVQKDYHIPFNTLIRKVITGKDSVLFGGIYSAPFETGRKVSADQALDQVPELHYRDNNLMFEFAAPYFESEEKTTFSYKLIGFDTAWSEWSSISFKQYTNLFEGEYTFSVRAMNIYGTVSAPASYRFVIRPPWYRTWTSYVAYFLILALVILLAVRLSVRRLRAAKLRLEQTVAERTAEVVQQKEELELKNSVIEVAFNDIKSSINYAKRIQESILPIRSEIENAFPESFVLFKPRDIVSGDFYWFSIVDEVRVLACVDCTGHGVPGAFMSMIGNTLLNEIVNEKRIIKPSEILDLLHERVRQSLRQDHERSETRDGMDIAIVVLPPSGTEIWYAGANRALYLVRNGQLTEVKADKYAIGGDQDENDRRFTNHVIPLQGNDCIYLSSDGYADQFGGPRGKKFMVKRFQQLLLEISAAPMHEQEEKLQKALEEWQGPLEQVDDILVIGIRL